MNLTILTFANYLFCCFIVAMLAFLIFSLLKEWMKKRIALEDEYDLKYESIESDLEDWCKDCDLKEYIEGEISHLLTLKWKNSEKSEILYNSYLLKCEEMEVKPNIVNPNI